MDRLLYIDNLERPLISEQLIEFLKKGIDMSYPDIASVPLNELLVHQGKIDLIRTLESIYNEQRATSESEG